MEQGPPSEPRRVVGPLAKNPIPRRLGFRRALRGWKCWSERWLANHPGWRVAAAFTQQIGERPGCAASLLAAAKPRQLAAQCQGLREVSSRSVRNSSPIEVVGSSIRKRLSSDDVTGRPAPPEAFAAVAQNFRVHLQ